MFEIKCLLHNTYFPEGEKCNKCLPDRPKKEVWKKSTIDGMSIMYGLENSAHLASFKYKDLVIVCLKVKNYKKMFKYLDIKVFIDNKLKGRKENIGRTLMMLDEFGPMSPCDNVSPKDHLLEEIKKIYDDFLHGIILEKQKKYLAFVGLLFLERDDLLDELEAFFEKHSIC